MSLIQSTIVAEVMTKSLRTDQESRIESLLNLVLRQMSQSYTEDGEPLPFEDLKKEHTFTLTENDYYEALPSDFVFIYSDPEIQYDTDKGHELIKLSIDDFKAMYPNITNDTSSKARPAHYAIDRGNIYFGPKCDDDTYSVKMLYTFLHDDISGDGDTIYFSDKFLMCIRDGILAELFDELDDFEKSDRYMDRHLSLLRAIAVVEKRNRKAVVISKPYN